MEGDSWEARMRFLRNVDVEHGELANRFATQAGWAGSLNGLASPTWLFGRTERGHLNLVDPGNF